VRKESSSRAVDGKEKSLRPGEERQLMRRVSILSTSLDKKTRKGGGLHSSKKKKGKRKEV